MFYLLVLFVVLFNVTNSASINNEFKVYKLNSLNYRQYLYLHDLEKNPSFYFPSKIEIRPVVEVKVPLQLQSKFEKWLHVENVKYDILSSEANSAEVPLGITRGFISFDKYYRYAEIQDYLKRLAAQYPNLVTLENYGVSFEGRNLTSLYVSSGGNKAKPIIFVDAGIHAREWIAPAQGLYIIDQILESDENKYLRDEVDWVLIPLLNPDGYEYTHTKERFWRKTRSKGKRCDGVDPNRNFDFHWGGIGSSEDECSNTYAGPVPFSEPETLSLSRHIEKYSKRTKLYLSFHSAAQSFLHPWGYTLELPENADELRSFAEEAEIAVEAVNGTKYKIGSSASTLAYAPGSSRDWAYGAAGVRLAYTMELPAGGDNRFDMPPERIYGVVQEMFEAVKVFHKNIVKKFSSA